MKIIVALLLAFPVLASACAPSKPDVSVQTQPDLFEQSPSAPDQVSLYLQDPGITVTPARSSPATGSDAGNAHSFKSRTVLTPVSGPAPTRLPSKVASGSDRPDSVHQSGSMMGMKVHPGSLR